jgi:Na+/H+-dicarboxylate symporter
MFYIVIFIGVVTATSSLSAKSNLHITLICVGLCLLTHVLANVIAVIGSIVLTSLSQTNKDATSTPVGSLLSTTVDLNKLAPQKKTFDIVADILRALIPKNIFKATTNQEITRFVPEQVNGALVYKRRVQYIDGTNILGILFFAILVGLSASIQYKKAEMFREFFKSANDVVILVLKWLIMFAPLGIASLIIDAILEVDDLGESFKQIGLFAGICVASLLVYGVLVLALLIFVFIRKNPFVYYVHFFEPMLLAFASTSGAVCIHKNMEICEKVIKMDQRMSRFTIPFYTTLQADGSAIFITMSCAFLANFSNQSLSVGDYIVIVIMTSILCLSLPSVPSASIVTILVVLNAINLSYLNISILYTVEWLLDRVRTAVNLYSHCFCAVITYELSKRNKDLKVEDEPSIKLEETYSDAENPNSTLNSSNENRLVPNDKINENELQDQTSL